LIRGKWQGRAAGRLVSDDGGIEPFPTAKKEQSLFGAKKLPVRRKLFPVPIHREFARNIMKLRAYPGDSSQ
jgi:hypothetical protein